MQRGLTGTYTSTIAGGVACQAFVPLPLPPVPALDLNGKLQSRLDEALIALGRLDAISTLLPDARLFVYSYAGHGAGSDRPRTQPRVYLRCLHPHVKSGNKLRNDNDIVQKTWNLCDVLRDDALALRLRRGLDISMAEIVS